jgi:dipeptidyl aminopeptidase/acylaminoacyl peptidase
MTRANLKRYKGSPATTDIVELPDRGHSLTMDSGWEEVAGTALNWLQKHLP